MLILTAFAQELYITLAHVSLAKANHMATCEFNKEKMYNFPAGKVPQEKRNTW